jgi:hypothetical protein
MTVFRMQRNREEWVGDSTRWLSPFTGNMPMRVTKQLVRTAILDAHRLGLSVTKKSGDAAYTRIHAA